MRSSRRSRARWPPTPERGRAGTLLFRVADLLTTERLACCATGPRRRRSRPGGLRRRVRRPLADARADARPTPRRCAPTSPGGPAERRKLVPPYGRWAVVRREDDAVIGGMELRPLPPHNEDVEIGWQLAPGAWGHGYATEAARALARYAFSQATDEVFAVVRPGNERAGAVAKRLGMEWVGETDKYYDLVLQVYRLRPSDLRRGRAGHRRARRPAGVGGDGEPGERGAPGGPAGDGARDRACGEHDRARRPSRVDEEALLAHLRVRRHGAVGEAEPVGLVDDAHDPADPDDRAERRAGGDGDHGPHLQRRSLRLDAYAGAAVRVPAGQRLTGRLPDRVAAPERPPPDALPPAAGRPPALQADADLGVGERCVAALVQQPRQVGAGGAAQAYRAHQPVREVSARLRGHRWLMRMPSSRGPLSTALLHDLPTGTVSERTVALAGELAADTHDALADDDLQISLLAVYELHHTGIDGVPAEAEWDPEVVRVARTLERAVERDVRRLVTDVQDPGGPVDLALESVIEQLDSGPSLSRYLSRAGTREQWAEYLAQKSLYHLKEADPHTFAIPRLSGRAKAALVEIQADEYGGGSAARMHSTLFARMMREFGLDDTYGAYVDDDLRAGARVDHADDDVRHLPPLARRAVGHLCGIEMTSTEPCRRLGAGLRRLRCSPASAVYYDEHVEADAVHEQLASKDLAGSLLAVEPQLRPDVIFGIAAYLTLESRMGAHLLRSWSALAA